MPGQTVRPHPTEEATVYRRTTITAAATALALLGGGSALAANAGLFGSDRPEGAGTLPAVSTPDSGPAADDTAPSGPTTEVPPAPADHDESDEDESHEDESHEDESHESAEVEDDD
jgi:hypothetical protein